MGWQDAPLVEESPAWASAPVVGATPPPKKKPKLNTTNLRNRDAMRILSDTERDFEQRISKLPPKYQEQARKQFYADPRIRKIHAAANRNAGPESDITTLGKQGITLGLSDEAAGAGGFLANLFTGQNPVESYTQFRDNERRNIRYARENSPVTGTLAEFMGAGGAVRTLPRAPSYLKAAKEGGAIGGIAGFGYGEGIESIPQAVMSAGFGAGLGLAGQFFGNKLAARKPKVREPKVIPQAAEIVEEGAKRGVPVLTTDVRPPKTAIGKNARSIGEKIPFVGTGGRRAVQQGKRVEAVRTLLREHGGDYARGMFDEAPRAVDDIARNLSTKRAADLTRLKGQKLAVIEGIPGNVPVDRTISKIDDQIAWLNSINDDAYRPVVSRLEGFKRQLMQGKTLSQIEGNRRLLGDMFKEQSLASLQGDGQKALNAIYDPLNAEMGTYIRNRGGQAAFTKWKSANTKLAEMAGELNVSAFKRALSSAEMTPEAVGKLLFSKDRSQVQRLVANLDEFGKRRAQAAVLQRAFDRSMDPARGLSVEKFINNIQSMDDSLGVVFKGPQAKGLERFLTLMDATRQASAAGAAPMTGVQNLPTAVGFSLGTLFGKAAIPVAAMGGLLARAYESAPVRNALIKLSRSTAGSAAERAAYVNATRALNTAITAQARRLGPALNDNFASRLAAEDEQQEQQGVTQP